MSNKIKLCISLTSNAPAAVSQLFRSASKYAVTLPHATHASMIAALPNMRIVRTGKLASAASEIINVSIIRPRNINSRHLRRADRSLPVIPFSMTSVDASVGAYPVTTTASNAVASSPTFIGEPFNFAPPPRVAVKHSSLNGSKITAACSSLSCASRVGRSSVFSFSACAHAR